MLSGRFFPKCKPEKKLEFAQTYSDCKDAYVKAGFISPKNSNPVKIPKSDDSTMDCEFENIYEQSKKCPKGWIGKAEDENCYKIQTFPATNDEAAAFCNQEGK